MTEKLNVLFLPRWYPGRLDPMPGLFVQQLAETLSEHCNMAVLSCQPDPDCAGNREIEIGEEQGVHVVRVYYRDTGHSVPILGNFFKALRFYLAWKEGFRALRSFRPDLVHVHVLTRHGLIAWIGKKMAGTPYAISEHWSRYYPETGLYTGILRKWLTKMIVREAAGVVAVSGKLKAAMEYHGLRNDRFIVIPNAVDMSHFIPDSSQEPSIRKKIVHVSCFDDRSKNISGLLNVLSRLALKRDDFTCELVGEGPDLEKLQYHAADLGLKSEQVHFSGLKTGDALVDSVKEADFLVLSSRYETFGTVIIESLACGIPVVATAVGIAPEIVTRNNGILIPPGDDDALLAAIDSMIDRCRQYSPEEIRQTVLTRFSNKTIVEQTMALYNQILNSR